MKQKNNFMMKRFEKFNKNSSHLETVIMKAASKIKKARWYFKWNFILLLINDPQLARFYLLPKTHKRLHDIPGRASISICGYYTKNISAFLDFHIQPLTKTVKFFIKDINNFFRKLKILGQLSENAILCTIDAVYL